MTCTRSRCGHGCSAPSCRRRWCWSGTTARSRGSRPSTGSALVANRLSPDRPPLWLASLDVTELRVAGGPERAEQLVSSLDADGLVLRLNGMDEALREDGQPLMRHATEAIASVAERLRPLPVVACGTGFGMDAADVRELRAAGVSAIDVGGGSGGGWGVSTADALAEGVLAADGLPLLAGVQRRRRRREVPRARRRRRVGRVAAAGRRRRARRAAPRGGVGDGRARGVAAHAGASARRVAVARTPTALGGECGVPVGPRWRVRVPQSAGRGAAGAGNARRRCATSTPAAGTPRCRRNALGSWGCARIPQRAPAAGARGAKRHATLSVRELPRARSETRRLGREPHARRELAATARTSRFPTQRS